MGLNVVSAEKSAAVNMPYIYKCKDWVIELCLMVWFGSLFLGEYLDWEKMPWYMYIVDAILYDAIYLRLKKKLPRSRWRTATYYLVSCVVVFAVAYVIIYFTKPGYFATSQEVVKALIVIAIFLLSAAVCAFLWRRRVVKGAEIIQRRAMKAKRRKITY